MLSLKNCKRQFARRFAKRFAKRFARRNGALQLLVRESVYTETRPKDISSTALEFSVKKMISKFLIVPMAVFCLMPDVYLKMPSVFAAEPGPTTEADIKATAVALKLIEKVNEACVLRYQKSCAQREVAGVDSFRKSHWTKPGYIILGSYYSAKYLHTPIGLFQLSGYGDGGLFEDHSLEDIESLTGIKLRKIHPYLYDRDSQLYGVRGPWYILDEFNGEVLADESSVPTYGNPNDLYILDASWLGENYPEAVFLKSLHKKRPLETWVKEVFNKASELLQDHQP